MIKRDQFSLAMQVPTGSRQVAGLATFLFDFELKDGHLTGGELKLQVIHRNRGVLHDKSIAQSVSFWLAINTLLLDDGLNTLRFELLSAGGHSEWSREVTLDVFNGSTIARFTRESLRAYGTPLVFDGYIDSKAFDYSDSKLIPWFDREDAEEILMNKFRDGQVSGREYEALRSFIKDGYAVLPDKIDDQMLRELNRAVDWAISTAYQGYQYGSSQRIEQLHQHQGSIARLWRHPLILDFLSKVFDSQPLPCQTLTYVFGSEQDFHQDTVHLTPFPAGYMCGVWVALEDIQADSGELVIIPGSHRLTRVYRDTVNCGPVRGGNWAEFGDKVNSFWEKLRQDSGLNELVYRPARGSILVWHENLMHGGSKRRNPELSRRAIVSHYFAHGATAYYDSTAMPGYIYT